MDMNGSPIGDRRSPISYLRIYEFRSFVKKKLSGLIFLKMKKVQKNSHTGGSNPRP